MGSDFDITSISNEPSPFPRSLVACRLETLDEFHRKNVGNIALDFACQMEEETKVFIVGLHFYSFY